MLILPNASRSKDAFVRGLVDEHIMHISDEAYYAHKQANTAYVIQKSRVCYQYRHFTCDHKLTYLLQNCQLAGF
jgi:hypothetical protein